MQPLQDQAKERAGYFWQDLKTLFKSSPDPERPINRWLYIAGAVFFMFPLGALLGYRFAYNKLYPSRTERPTLNDQPRIIYAAMYAGALLVVVLPIALFFVAVFIAKVLNYRDLEQAFPIMGFIFFNLIATSFVMLSFHAWRSGINRFIAETERYGTAKYMDPAILHNDYGKSQINKGGFYIGPATYYAKSGHLLTVAGTRAGKGVNLIVPNLLKIGPFNRHGSWVIIDPKGENAAVTAQAQRDMGRKVIMLNPWDLLKLGNSPYNPLDILKADKYNLVDDVEMIAESIVPKGPDTDDHFNNRARSLISGLLLHLVTRPHPTAGLLADDKHLGTLWQWLRLDSVDFANLLLEMVGSKHPFAGQIVQATAFEITALMTGGEREWSSIRSTAQKWTDFLKSPALRESLQQTQGFNSADLAHERTTVYIIIPADRLKTHFQWLRLLVTTLIRSVIRKPQNDVCFLLDEYYALGYLSEIDVALGSYAGYGVHVWAILQNLVQLQEQHGTSWENFISSCSVRHFFNVSDNTSADYISAMFGQTSVPITDMLGNITGASPRSLLNPDELRKSSANTIYTVIDQHAPAQLYKYPYYMMPDLTEGSDYARNPYVKQIIKLPDSFSSKK